MSNNLINEMNSNKNTLNMIVSDIVVCRNKKDRILKKLIIYIKNHPLEETLIDNDHYNGNNPCILSLIDQLDDIIIILNDLKEIYRENRRNSDKLIHIYNTN